MCGGDHEVGALLLINGVCYRMIYNVERSIKLWKVFAKEVRSFTEYNLLDPRGQRPAATPYVATSRIRFPKIARTDHVVASNLRRGYAHNHAYHVNSLSASCDQETFLSGDDLRINLWHLDNPTENFTVVDIKPENMEFLEEVITRAVFDPTHAHRFAYGTSKGRVVLSDMRTSALLDAPRQSFTDNREDDPKMYFKEIVTQISDVRFSRCSKYIMARDYMSLKIWDIRMNSILKTIDVHDYLRDQLVHLYDRESIYDRFECHWSEDGKSVMTGTYSNNFMVYDAANGTLLNTLEASKNASTRRRRGLLRRRRDSEADQRMKFDEKVIHSSWHPKQKTMAVAAANTLYLFHASRVQPAEETQT